MIRIWYSGDEKYHTFESVSQIGDWIGRCNNPSIVCAEFTNRTLQLTIGDPTKREATFREFSDVVTDHGTADRGTAARAFLARLSELTT